MNFSEKDKAQILSKGLTIEKVITQIQTFEQGLPPANLVRAATKDDGISVFLDSQKEDLITYFDNEKDKVDIYKFVPASGAATRMFKFLFKFLKEYKPNKESVNAYINRTGETALSVFLVGLEKLPFYGEVLKEVRKRNENYDSLSPSKRALAFVTTMLSEDALDLSSYPKGLLPFHEYKQHVTTAFEEHLFESALYVAANGKANLHFTISEKHKNKFDDEFKRIEEIVERKTETSFNIDFSYQKEATDTIAVTTKNEPFRNDDGSLLFRPSGHGALIENLNDIEADIIFIKNIDNVVVYKYEEQVANYKKMLAGLLLQLRDKSYKYCSLLSEDVSEAQLIEIAEFLSNELNVVISDEFEKYALKYQVEYLKEKLDRPIRVCGMVKNEGEPGGGPFWAKDQRGITSLQIVESAQIDKKNKTQKQILKSATHFNPVDLVCSVKNYKGEKYDLTKFIDHNTAFITMKTKTGKDIKALELPGLWNGSMAYWNTIFVEVPLITFNPVKTVNDLLKGAHQVK